MSGQSSAEAPTTADSWSSVLPAPCAFDGCANHLFGRNRRRLRIRTTDLPIVAPTESDAGRHIRIDVLTVDANRECAREVDQLAIGYRASHGHPDRRLEVVLVADLLELLAL